MINLHQIWAEECETAKVIEAEFGTEEALDYLIDENFLNFLEAADSAPAFRVEVPAFAEEIKSIFERWQLAEYLENVRVTGPFDPSIYDDEATAKFEKWLDIRQSAADLLLIERAREWLLDEEE